MAIIKQLFDEASATLSYLLADSASREAAVIDPVAGHVADYKSLLEAHGLRLRYVLETHLHDDHPSGAMELVRMTGARLAVHRLAGLPGCDRPLADGELIRLGEEFIEVIHTPGHTPCSVSYSFWDRLFTGDTLGIGWVGALSRPGGDASQLYDSVHGKLYSLPNETLVYPGHDYAGHRVSCVGQEKLTNADLPLVCTREAFVAARTAVDSAGCAFLPGATAAEGHLVKH
ncbi:MAG TPA: MBL fold metallo-hydrolase [Gammaproteobacteria bacterium]|nr:MBL fold metallo-hydrolase [Gammaproteobacteria bacterium]